MMTMVNMVTMFVNSFRVQTRHDKATGLPRQKAHGQWSVRKPYSDVMGSSASVVLLCSLAELRNPSSADAIVTCMRVP
jgi:hypothetical protein